MKAILILYHCVALMPSNIFGRSSSESGLSPYSEQSSSSFDPFEEVFLNEAQAKVDQKFQNKNFINNIFRPTKFLGRGGFSITYEGELVLGNCNKTVAMKFSPVLMMEDEIVNEYEMYTYLKAIDNSTVENYGVPAVYYYGDWEGCKMMAITLLDSKFNEICKAPELKMNDIDIFIMCREFVRTTKYIHSHGVCHNDVKLDNLMFRKNRAFLIDYNLSRKVADIEEDCRKKDWESFLLCVCYLCGLNTDSEETINIIKGIGTLKHSGLKRVLIEFAKYAFKVDPINYNKMYKTIREEIKKRVVHEPALVSWLKDEEKNETITPSSDIRLIGDPYTVIHFTYPPINHVNND